MRLREARKPFLAGGLLLAFLLTIPAVSAVTRPALAGTVRSALGGALDDVEVLVLRERGPEPIAVARTDGTGQFLVADLPIGIYRVVAVKDGYATWLGRVSIALRTTLDLVLQPAVVDPTMDPDWVLRVPDRSLLRETEAIAVLDLDGEDVPGKGGPTVAHLQSNRLVQGEVGHLFAFGADAVEGPRTHTEGGETRLRLASHPGERAHVRFEGRREALDAASRRQSADLLLDASYDTSLEGRLAVRAFYATRDTALDRVPHSARTWGYQAGFTRQFGPDSRLAFDLAYLDAGTPVLPLGGDGAVPSAGRALGASARYERRLDDRHQVRLGMRTRSADLSALRLVSADALRGPESLSLLAGVPDPLGWGLRLDAEDAVRLSTPVTLVYGLGYEADLAGARPDLFVQRAGIVWSAADLRVDLRLSRHTLGAEIEDPMGWEAAVEVPLIGGFRLRGAAASSPVQAESLDGPGLELPAERAAYLSDGLASTREERLTLQHEARHTRAFLEMTRGTADGRLAAVRPANLSVGALDDRHLDFVAGRLGVRLVPTGTELAAEYRKVLVETPGGLLSGEPTEGEYVELRLAQDLVRMAARGAAWRLLLAARASQDGPDLADGSGDGTQHWMGAGISLAF
jgi:hypothetical protein